MAMEEVVTDKWWSQREQIVVILQSEWTNLQKLNL
jgi:hypothetical protein